MTINWYCFDYLAQSKRLLSAEQPPSTAGRRARGRLHHSAITAGKTTRAYNAHSYPTKVPPEAIEPFIEHYTQPGDIVFDPFCGSGMTGLAALRLDRRSVLSDVSPLAVHLAYNHTTPCEPRRLLQTWQRLRASLQAEELRHYEVGCRDCEGTGVLRYTIWSDVYRCPGCAGEVCLWETATDRVKGAVSKILRCGSCGSQWRKAANTRVRVEPAWLAYSCSCSSQLQQRAPTSSERQAAQAFHGPSEHLFVPCDVVAVNREMYRRSALHLRDIRTVRDFYTNRNLSALATLWQAIGEVGDLRVRNALAFAFTNTAWHGTRMRRFNARGGHRPLTGTLYIPQLSSEANIFEVFDHKVHQLARFYAEIRHEATGAAAIRLSSATDLSWIADGSVDYVFTDPPFGSNIFYADCNLISESWLGVLTDVETEAVVNRSRSVVCGGKTAEDYGRLLEQAFREIHRVLKPSRWATVVFQSSDGQIWETIEQAAQRAGFVLHSTNMLNKVQQSMKGYKGRNGAENVASFDLVLHLRKRGGANKAPLHTLSTEACRGFVLHAIERHLAALSANAPQERSLPFLYSLAVRSLLNAGVSVSALSMEMLRAILVDALEEQGGYWYLPAERVTAG
jgi:DNA modification methylase